MTPKLNGHEKIFLFCPKMNENVEAIPFCVDCRFFGGFVCPQIDRVKQRKELGEVTQENLDETIDKYADQPKLWFVQCAFPVLRQCSLMKTGGGDGKWQQQ